MILIYVTCENADQAREIGKSLLEKRLCACVNIFPTMHSLYFWPAGSNTVEESAEFVLIIKTLAEKYDEVEREVTRLHTYDTPSVFSIPVDKVSSQYLAWIKGEIAR